jgi:hypothetical protein
MVNIFVLNIIMLDVIMLSVVMVSVVAPFRNSLPKSGKHYSLYSFHFVDIKLGNICQGLPLFKLGSSNRLVLDKPE